MLLSVAPLVKNTSPREARTTAALAVVLGCTSAWSQVANPCAYTNIDVAKYGRQDLRNPPNISAQGGALTTTLDVQYTDPKTTSIAGCPVMLRTYNGQLVGPTLRVRPGETLNVMLNNRLPKETPDQIQQQFEQENKSAHLSTRPASFNTTNLHTHGLQVSRAWAIKESLRARWTYRERAAGGRFVDRWYGWAMR